MKYVAQFRLGMQCSPDYDISWSVEVMEVSEATTISEIMAWYNKIERPLAKEDLQILKVSPSEPITTVGGT